jgi:hypothetical protein
LGITQKGRNGAEKAQHNKWKSNLSDSSRFFSFFLSSIACAKAPANPFFSFSFYLLNKRVKIGINLMSIGF